MPCAGCGGGTAKRPKKLTEPPTFSPTPAPRRPERRQYTELNGTPRPRSNKGA